MSCFTRPATVLGSWPEAARRYGREVTWEVWKTTTVRIERMRTKRIQRTYAMDARSTVRVVIILFVLDIVAS